MYFVTVIILICASGSKASEILTDVKSDLSSASVLLNQILKGIYDDLPIPESKIGITCPVCLFMVRQTFSMLSNGTNLQVTIETLTKLCRTSLPEYVCRGIVSSHLPIVQYVIKHTHESEVNIGKRMCAEFLNKPCDKKLPGASEGREWEVNLEKYGNKISPDVVHRKPKGKVMKILQLTDVHLDFHYSVGSKTLCEAPLCCQADSIGILNETAGTWGSYGKCGLPMKTFLHLLNHIKENHKDIGIIFWTGDAPPHKIWDTSRNEVLDYFQTVSKEINNYFPNTPVHHSVGNHDVYPVNCFAPDNIDNPEMSTKWLYKTLAKEWMKWADESIGETVFRGGFYSYGVLPGLRIISVNTNQCQHFNWWNYLEVKDIDDQLTWMADELYKAEVVGEKVYLLGHVPPGDVGCMKTWSHQFNRVIERFSGTITAQFYGHTHRDELIVYYNEDNEPFSTGFVAPSITTYPKLNPSYRIYTADVEGQKPSYDILDFETYIGNIGKANEDGYLSWELSYKMRENYELEDLSVISLGQLSKKILTESKYFMKYYENFEKKSPGWEGYDQKALDYVKCRIVLTDRARHPNCEKFLTSLPWNITKSN